MKNRILSLLMALVLIFALSVNASAAGTEASMPDLDQKGSLSFKMDVGGVSLSNGKLNLYYVATVVKVEENKYDFRLLDELTEAGAKLDTGKLNDRVQVEKLLAVSKDVLTASFTAPIVDGAVTFSDLDAGLYLVWQNNQDASDGYDAIQPFLISVPRWQDGTYSMHVEAAPKVPFETEPPTEPPTTEPPPPQLPQTGQLNWPVPVMAIAGVVLFVVGWILCCSRKRIENEE